MSAKEFDHNMSNTPGCFMAIAHTGVDNSGNGEYIGSVLHQDRGIAL